MSNRIRIYFVVCVQRIILLLTDKIIEIIYHYQSRNFQTQPTIRNRIMLSIIISSVCHISNQHLIHIEHILQHILLYYL